jgi:hypothetical protein
VFDLHIRDAPACTWPQIARVRRLVNALDKVSVLTILADEALNESMKFNI